jgi:hypothetical protein
MRMVHTLSASVLCAAAVLAGCGKTDWDWWKKPKDSPKASAKDANQEISPQEAVRLRDDNKTLRDQLADLQARDQQLSEELRQTKILYEGQLNVTETLKKAPDERDKALAQAKDLKAENELLRQEILVLKGGGALPTSRPAPAATAPTQPAPPPASIQPAQTAPAQTLPEPIVVPAVPLVPAATPAPSPTPAPPRIPVSMPGYD